MINLFFYLHMVGVGIFLAYVLYALVIIVRCKGPSDDMRKLAIMLAGYQAGTGVLLALANPALSIQTVCIRGLVFTSVLLFLSVSISKRARISPGL